MVEPSDRWVGHVDRYDTSGVHGWAADREDMNRSVTLEMVDETGRLLTRCVADLFRHDLVEEGFGNGKHGFFLPFDERAKAVRTASIRFMETEIVLNRGVIEMDVETMMFSSPMPERYVRLMRALARDLHREAADASPFGSEA